MSKRIRRILLAATLVIMATVLFSINVFAARDAVGDLNRDGVVDSEDAIHLLGYTIFEEIYPLDQPCDYDNNGVVDSEDAIYLLGNTIFEDIYHICDHPDTWEETEIVGATCKEEGYTLVTCSCGKTERINPTPKTDDHDFDWENPNTDNQATCVENGYITATCTVCGAVDTQQQLATGHSMSAGTCTEGPACANCDHTEPARGHVYGTEPVHVEAPTCQGGYEEYKCNDCDDTYRVELVPVDHRADENGWQEVGEQQVDGCQYVYVEQATCADCGEAMTRTTEFIKHTEKVTVTPATCKVAGSKDVKCGVCGIPLSSTVIPVPENKNELVHSFDEGVVNGSVTTYTCAACGETKKTVRADENGKVDISAAEEVVLENNTAVQPDEGLKELYGGQEVAISVGTASAETIENLSPENKELLQQLGDTVVYDLSMTVGDQPVSQFGDNKMTVRLPYELQEGDDPDCIKIWYIGDDGNIQPIDAKYVDGYAVFETNHFSYYTVLRMTPAERCAYYGEHSDEVKSVPPTCVTEGYTVTICTRCGRKEISDKKAARGHVWNDGEITKPATCTITGTKHYDCKACEASYDDIIKATGHSYQVDEAKGKTPSCTTAGERYTACRNEGCGDHYTEKLPQLEHEYETVELEATCETEGYTHHKCKNCSHEYNSDVKKALGHRYSTDGICERCEAECVHEYEYGLCKTCKHEKEKPVLPEPKPEEPDPEEPKPEDPSCKHNYEYTSYEFINKDLKNCAYGVSITETCTECGESRTVRTSEHYQWLVKVDLSNYDTCGKHALDYLTCPCGYATEWLEDPNINEEFETPEGGYGIRCGNCELYALATLIREVDTCSSRISQTINFYFGDAHLFDVSASMVEETHALTNVEITYLSDKASCEGGVVVTATCAVCEKAVSYTLYDHLPVVTTKIDLAQYGACESHSFTTQSCACGEEQSVSIRGFNRGMTSSNGVYTQFCDACSVRVETVTKQGEINADCTVIHTRTYTVYAGKEAKESLVLSSIAYAHEYLTKVELAPGATSCKDGLIITYTCCHCGNTYQTMQKDHYFSEKKLDLSAYGVCEHHNVVVYGCIACDYNTNLWSYTDLYSQKTENGWFYFCENCPLTITQTQTLGERDENCFMMGTRLIVIACGKETVQTITESFGTIAHEYETTYEFAEGSTSCEDGVTVHRTCKHCGVTNDYQTEGHECETVYIDAAEYGICEDHNLQCDQCIICGQIAWIGYDNCYGQKTEEGWLFGCDNCDLTITEIEHEGEKDESCYVTGETHTTAAVGDTVILTGVAKYVGYQHDYQQSYELMEGSKSCEDGVRIIYTCKNCGDSYSKERYGHIFKSQTLDFTAYGGCKIHRGAYEVCTICNTVTSIYKLGGFVTQNTAEGTHYTCPKCDVQMIERHVYGEKDKNCQVPVHTTMTLLVGKEVLMTAESTSYTSQHTYKYSYTFLGKEQNCKEGVTVREFCTDCSYSEEWQIYGHESFIIDRIALADHGHACGTGELQIVGCPCGESYQIEANISDFKTVWSNKEIDGIFHELATYTCTCGYQFTLDIYQVKDEFCNATTVRTYTLADGEQLSYSEKRGKSHSTTQKELPDESSVIKYADGSWTEILAYEEYCKDCFASLRKDVYTRKYDAKGDCTYERGDAYYYVALSETETIAVPDYTSIYTYVTVPYKFDQGKATITLSNKYIQYDENGKESSWTLTEYLYEDGSYCHYTVRETNSGETENVRIETSHRGTVSGYVLSEGSKTCLDGVDRVYYCVLCGEETSRRAYTSNGQHMLSISDVMLSEKLDLREYGAVCETYLKVYACACGERQELHVEVKCDFGSHSYWQKDENGIEHQYTVYTCAVTDPETCGFKYVRDRWYSVDADCNETVHYTYYLGVNEENNAYVTSYAISYVTGNKRHEKTDTAIELDENRYFATTACVQCGTVIETVEIVDNVRTETSYYYHANGAMSQKNVNKYITVENDRYEYPLLYRTEYYDAEGKMTSWDQSEYRYPNAANGDYCSRERVWSNSNGNETVEEEESHNWWWTGEFCTPTPCEQYCDKCGATRIEMIYQNGHSFDYDKEKGLYVCWRCGLESAAGGNGAVGFEDKTLTEGNGTDYVLGWYNNYGDAYTWSVMLVAGERMDFVDVKVVEDGDYRLRLDAGAIAAAAEKLGYGKCGYMVRVAFVPTDAGGELDYAITLDPHVYTLEEYAMPKDGCLSGAPYFWTYACVFCGKTKTVDEYGHFYDNYREEKRVLIDKNGNLVVTFTSGSTCKLCGDTNRYTTVKTYLPNGQPLQAERYEDGKLFAVTTYTYDYKAGIRTMVIKYANGDTHTEQYDLVRGRLLSGYDEYAGGGWNKYEYTYDDANNVRTETHTESGGYTYIRTYEIDTGRHLTYVTKSPDGSTTERTYVYINGRRFTATDKWTSAEGDWYQTIREFNVEKDEYTETYTASYLEGAEVTKYRISTGEIIE